MAKAEVKEKAPCRSKITLGVTGLARLGKTQYQCEKARNHAGDHQQTLIEAGKRPQAVWLAWERR